MEVVGNTLKIKITSPFGATEPFRTHPHKGIDINLPYHTELRSLMDGYIQKIVDYGDTNLGKGVYIKFKDGTTGIYGHLSEFADIHVNQPIKAGQLFGYSGNSGFSTGAHLHFQMLNEQGEVVDPTPVINKVAEMSVNNPNAFEKIGNWFLERGQVDNYENADYNFWVDTVWATLKTDLYEAFHHAFMWTTDHLPIMMGMTTVIFGFLYMFGIRPHKMGTIYLITLGGVTLWRLFT